MKFIANLTVAALILTAGQAHANTINFAEVLPGKIYRGGIEFPQRNDFENLRRRGIKTDLNLRDFMAPVEAVESDLAEDEGLRYIHNGISPMLISIFPLPEQGTVDRALVELLDEANYPIFVHCYKGVDRTGMVIALYRLLFSENWQNENVDQVFKEEMLDFGYKPFVIRVKDYLYLHSKNRKQERARIFGLLKAKRSARAAGYY